MHDGDVEITVRFIVPRDQADESAWRRSAVGALRVAAMQAIDPSYDQPEPSELGEWLNLAIFLTLRRRTIGVSTLTRRLRCSDELALALLTTMEAGGVLAREGDAWTVLARDPAAALEDGQYELGWPGKLERSG